MPKAKNKPVKAKHGYLTPQQAAQVWNAEIPNLGGFIKKPTAGLQKYSSASAMLAPGMWHQLSTFLTMKDHGEDAKLDFELAAIHFTKLIAKQVPTGSEQPSKLTKETFGSLAREATRKVFAQSKATLATNPKDATAIKSLELAEAILAKYEWSPAPKKRVVKGQTNAKVKPQTSADDLAEAKTATANEQPLDEPASGAKEQKPEPKTETSIPSATSLPKYTLGMVVEEKCPNCDGPMMVRKTKSGQNAGKLFLGCKNFPDCRGLKSILSEHPPTSA